MHIRHLTLASLALTAVVGIAPSACAASAAAPSQPRTTADRPCGQPEIPPVYTSIEHPAVTKTVPAVTEDAWRWTRSRPTVEHEYARLVRPATGTVRWTRVVEVREREYVRTVIDRPAVPASPEIRHEETRVVTPAVTVTEWEYVQHQNGRTRWERDGWNAGDNGTGWSRTGATRVVEVTPAVTEQVWVVDRAAVPAVPELSHVETTWVREGDAAPAGASATGEIRLLSSTPESRDLAPGDVPAGDGWTEGGYTETAPAVVDRVWLAEGVAPESGYDATHATRAGRPLVETTPDPTALPPEGDGWERVDGSYVALVVTPEHVVEVTPAWVEDFVVLVPGEPATPACPTDPGTGEGSEGSEGPQQPGQPVLPAGPVVAPIGTADPAVAGASVGAPATGPAEDATADVLPATGTPVAPWLVALGAGSAFAGAVLVRRSRRECPVSGAAARG